jgi:UDP-N-acetylglucosamine 2-epimerase (non-hydrolysing)
MIDSLHYCLRKLEDQTVGPSVPPYAAMTLHRPSNVDDRDRLSDILSAMAEISKDMPVYFPAHPRTEANIGNFGLGPAIRRSNISVSPPLSYLKFLALWKNATAVFTDSGGLQEETTALGVPCFTLRDNTERPITVEEGTNVLAGTRGGSILAAYRSFKAGGGKQGSVPELWDGRAAERIVEVLSRAA